MTKQPLTVIYLIFKVFYFEKPTKSISQIKLRHQKENKTDNQNMSWTNFKVMVGLWYEKTFNPKKYGRKSDGIYKLEITTDWHIQKLERTTDWQKQKLKIKTERNKDRKIKRRR